MSNSKLLIALAVVILIGLIELILWAVILTGSSDPDGNYEATGRAIQATNYWVDTAVAATQTAKVR